MSAVFSPPHIHDSGRWKNKRVGLLGGSFNPPHEGHIHASMVAQRALQLDVVWWMVTPQNPLKEKSSSAFEKRMALCEDFTRHYPEILVTDIENEIGTNKTWLTVSKLRRLFPLTEFVWITGMDNALSMHKWHHWRRILQAVPTAHVARPPAWNLIEQCPLKMLSQQNHFFLDRSQKVNLKPGNTYWLLQKQLLDVSSTNIRKSNS
ncbi:MAG TPA: nicotinate-nicotinamide nucleotide adenylyltransferase [Micavibrio sp.]|nr:nicotinate-nicotinamide nucleotide adenylyltransferase [Micavibrio sp.]HIL28718.1 nicotinate-nicotinamide nucleotide adenylyltransferase [Micavibrio sp.]